MEFLDPDTAKDRSFKEESLSSTSIKYVPDLENLPYLELAVAQCAEKTRMLTAHGG